MVITTAWNYFRAVFFSHLLYFWSLISDHIQQPTVNVQVHGLFTYSCYQMRKLFISAVLPLTVLLFFVWTKWWYVLPEDGPDKLFWGFPFAFMGEGFHTSMSFQFFVLPFVADFMIYLSVTWLLLFILKKLRPSFVMPGYITKACWTLSVIMTLGMSVWLYVSDTVFHINRPYRWQVMTSGAVFIWQNTAYPDIRQYHPGGKKETVQPAMPVKSDSAGPSVPDQNKDLIRP